jgi:hypothetical protein
MEELIGFTGYLHMHTWKYVGEQVVLAPWGIKAEQATLGGKGKRYPVDPWELRYAVVVETLPQDTSHPYSRRRFYFDKQTYASLFTLIYDREGNHFRTFFHCYGNPAYNPLNSGVRIPLLIGDSKIDYYSQTATVLVLKKQMYDQSLPPKLFTVKEMLRRGK